MSFHTGACSDFGLNNRLDSFCCRSTRYRRRVLSRVLSPNKRTNERNQTDRSDELSATDPAKASVFGYVVVGFMPRIM